VQFFHLKQVVNINESTRMQLDDISTALAELQADHRQQPKRKPIGFIQPKDDEKERLKGKAD
jgi:DNA recombination-dependent growth factor C